MTGQGPAAPAGGGIHYLRGNKREWSPADVVTLATSAAVHEADGGEVHDLTGWAAVLTVRRSQRKDGTGQVTAAGATTAELAAQLGEWACGVKSLWLFCADLPYDLSLLRLPPALCEQGWAVTSHAVTTDSPWIRMRRGSCTLTLADARGWLRCPAAALGADYAPAGSGPGPEPGALPGGAGQAGRTAGILAAALTSVMDWWDRNRLGNWGLTGTATGWNAMRHQVGDGAITINLDPAGVALDRAAVYGGRREATIAGHLPAGDYRLLDFEQAYATIAANCPLPVKRGRWFTSMPVAGVPGPGAGWGIIAECEVETDVPRWPLRAGTQVIYPVGRFRTTLAHPEILAARDAGCLREVGRGQAHILGTVLQPWFRWVAAAAAGDVPGVPAAARRLVKHWGRACTGKWAQHGSEVIATWPATHGGWHYEQTWNWSRLRPGHVAEIGDTAISTVETDIADNCYPAVLAWIESECRRRLSAVIDALGRAEVITCDTDGLITAAPAGNWPPALASLTAPLILREKQRFGWLDVAGPQHLRGPGYRKMSGIPSTAKPTPDGHLEAWLWPGLTTQMTQMPAGGYLRQKQVYTIPRVNVAGWVMEGGHVIPPRTQVRDSHATVICDPAEKGPWPEWLWPREQQNTELVRAIGKGP